MNVPEPEERPHDLQAKEIERLKLANTTLRNSLAVLEEENAALIALLKQHGVDARMPSQMSAELPPPLATPLDIERHDVFLNMRGAERELCRATADGRSVFLLLATDSRADTGSWFRRGRIYAMATAESLALFAAGRRPFAADIKFARLLESIYNHCTGEVVLAPAKGLAIASLRIPPANGYQLLAQIYASHKTIKQGEQYHA